MTGATKRKGPRLIHHMTARWIFGRYISSVAGGPRVVLRELKYHHDAMHLFMTNKSFGSAAAEHIHYHRAAILNLCCLYQRMHYDKLRAP